MQIIILKLIFCRFAVHLFVCTLAAHGDHDAFPSQVAAFVFFILSLVAFAGWVGWNITVSVSWFVYVLVVFFIEMFIDGLYVHRLIVSFKQHLNSAILCC